MDVLVIGEVLVEVSSPVPFAAGVPATLSFSGDALNAAAAAADAGASVALLTKVGDDELGTALLRHVERLGVDTSLAARVAAPNGVYFSVADLNGGREFVYVRRGSAASTLSPDDVERLPEHRVLLAGGIAQAISAGAAAAVQRAAERAPLLVYDPNFRPRLTTPERARAALARIAPFARVVTPSWPADGLGDTPRAAAEAVLALGAQAAAVTCGPDGVLVRDGAETAEIPAAPAERLVDATGAGDVFAGTLAAHLARGATVVEAAREGVVAAARSLGGQGGTGHLAYATQGEPV
ncbi:PfkB family carbohydrate kinase [Candidatus Solirubrobacter pratensis]|uniref:PfkB family carbohydrate kinase n=1 Tax=Candidatus Solirubrobacter pratensis TaxID=1298857 RepID=UPI0004162790|nr:PfkB family carbohydrate kinase [Candidatus Solirubrobacter pratensis]